MDLKLGVLFILIGTVIGLSKLATKSQRGIDKQKWLVDQRRN